MINGLPSPPTDNLYKFLAISGIVCVLVANIMSVQVMVSTHDKIEQTLDSFVKNGNEQGWKLFEQFRLDYPDKADHEKMIKLRSEELKRTVAVDTKNCDDRVSEIKSDEEKSQKGLTALAVVGSIIALFGFGLWALRFQRFQDGGLRLEFETAKREFEKKHPGEYEAMKFSWIKPPRHIKK